MRASPCSPIQETIVAGRGLGESEQAHVLVCPRCARVAADCAGLDAVIAGGMDGIVVPDDFADSVMARVETEGKSSRLDRLLGRPAVQWTLAYVGFAVAIGNVVRFVLAMLVPSASLGGRP